MTIRSILVHVDASADSLARMALTRDLAMRLQARLIGVAVGRLTGATLLGGLPPALLAEQEQRLRQAMRALGDHFDLYSETVEREWRSAVGAPADVLATHARAADMIVVGRASAEDAGQEFHLAAADAVMRAGRPVLIVPPSIERIEARRIVVPWKAGRAACLAVQLALSLLVRAEDVLVLGVGDETAEDELTDVRDHLLRHGVKARAEWRSLKGYEVEQVIVDEAERNAADLIACGAFGRPRALEWALGGVTEALLQRSPVCCLMAH